MNEQRRLLLNDVGGGENNQLKVLTLEVSQQSGATENATEEQKEIIRQLLDCEQNGIPYLPIIQYETTKYIPTLIGFNDLEGTELALSLQFYTGKYKGVTVSYFPNEDRYTVYNNSL